MLEKPFSVKDVSEFRVETFLEEVLEGLVQLHLYPLREVELDVGDSVLQGYLHLLLLFELLEHHLVDLPHASLEVGDH